MHNTDLPNRADLPSTKQLLKSTALAAAVAATLLITCILPAEYGIDPTGIGQAIGLKKMGEIKQQLHQEADAEATASVIAAPLEQPTAISTSAANTPLSLQQHEMRVTLEPNQATEIKLSMPKATVVQYRWVTEGGGLNFDTHGDIVNAPKDFYHGYGKGVNQTEDAGQLTAAFDGKHGWFWRNRGKQAVTVTLTTKGAYEKIERVF
ncbi:MAG: transmembrane anchor protein [Moraxellaceae bacterium]